MPRLFTGIELPEEIRDQLGDLEQPLPGVRFIEEDNLHITLRFAGDIDNGTAREFSSFLDGIQVPAFEMRLEGLGTFGGKEPRTLWSGVVAGPELEQLARANERAARAAGLKPETRGFKPHVTIARLNKPRIDALSRFLTRHAMFRSRPFIVDRFVLYSSKPNVGGGPYVIEETFPLLGAAWNDESSDGPDSGRRW
ncbi:MAG: RNA 2',3'-cyclic phosphodiesterase [Hyphomicrobiaceae bacterium]|nr:RNA 2',3'-cyclic phosphodiesterase [Hyphomicrobiaceae bacterium]